MKFFTLIFIIFILLGCDQEKQISQPFTVAFSCDTQGRIEPCGCFSGQFGGLSRIYTKLGEFQNGLIVKVDVGDAISGKEDYDLILYKYVQTAFTKMNYHAMNAGVREASLNLTQLKSINQQGVTPLISANLYSPIDKAYLFKRFVIVEYQGLRVLITGVVDPDLMGERLGQGVEVKNMAASISEVLASEKADMKILLAFCSPEKMKELADKFFEFNLILGGAVKQPSQKIIKQNRSVILATTNEAKNIGYVIGDLTAKGIENVDFDIPLLTTAVKENEEILDLMTAYREEIKKSKLGIDANDSISESLIPGVNPQATFVGSNTCATCHPTSHSQWLTTSHAHAFESLKKKNSDADPKCIKCHTVGFGEASGYLREFKDARLTDVGCESCHGPGSEHVRQRSSDLKTLFKYRPLGEGDCKQCHHGEFSRPFDWDNMWPKILHGKEKK